MINFVIYLLYITFEKEKISLFTIPIAGINFSLTYFNLWSDKS